MPAFFFVPILAQFLVSADAQSMETIKKVFEGPARESTLQCRVETLNPRLGFSLMHWSGFNLLIPMKQFPPGGEEVRFGLAIEITPKGGKSVYLGDRFAVPRSKDDRPAPKGLMVNYMAGYYVGPGEYRVRIYAGDNRNAECTKEWSIRAAAGKAASRLEPNQVTAVGEERWRGLAKDGPENRLTVILDASPLMPRRNMVKLSSYDRSVLLTSLVTLLDTTRATSANVIAVDPRNRKIIFQTERFTQRELRRLARAVDSINMGIVSVDTLRGPSSSDFMETVLAAAQDPASRSDATVFLGPVWSWYGKLTPRSREIAQGLPNAHFLGLTRFPGLPDNLVAQVVKAANGRVKQLVTPNDFAKALEKVK
ncbi:MAG TPA: hypothetical protein VFQ91_27865 [Bryobacteraceae bacterium]|nr:hypothetical protein [Bryobacteraceae bacterium]